MDEEDDEAKHQNETHKAYGTKRNVKFSKTKLQNERSIQF